MKNRVTVIFAVMLLTIALVAGVVLASNANEEAKVTKTVQIMRDRGFEDVARCMEDDHHEQMEEYMINLSEEDFQEMIDLMKENGYESMAEVMESLGSEGMIDMHSAMRNMHRRGSVMHRMHARFSGTRGCH